MGRTWSSDNFDNRPTKRFLEQHIYKKAGKIITSHVMVITGPAVLEHLPNVIKVAKTKKYNIYIIEIDYSVYEVIEERLGEKYKISYLSYSNGVVAYDVEDIPNRVTIAYGDVENYENLFSLKLPCRFEDLDLCQTFKKSKNRNIFSNRLFKQSRNYNEKYGKLRKLFMGTVSLRGHNMQKTVEYINTGLLSLLDAKIDVKPKYSGLLKGDGWLQVNNISMYKPKILKQGRIKTLDMYSYRDGSPMFCFVITYR